MKPTPKQLERQYSPFQFRYRGRKSWFYLMDGVCSFHQETPVAQSVQQNVHGLRVSRLIKALEDCGYISRAEEKA